MSRLFIPTQTGWLYRAILMDSYPRKIVGWSMSNRNDQTLVSDARHIAVQRQKPAAGTISNTSRKKACWDNAVAEYLFSTLKNELTWGA